MTDIVEIEPLLDGRAARRERNIDNVLDAVLEMFAEESLFPTIEQASKRSGLSVRSLYRYFADPGELLEAVIERNREVAADDAYLSSIGRGPLHARVEDFIAMRMRLYDRIGPVYRATVANAALNSRIRDELATTRNELRDQFERQFAPELDERKRSDRAAVMSAGDVITQLDSIDFLRRHRQLAVADTENTLRMVLLAVLG
ncbi:MAG: TetR/AcrR family transcriptional regulator [Acidimicrobiaceae bacterium]|nr:TetR/AcrR family transcriptional regulator [Acidimicrobiaceae bacterium]